MEPLEGCIDVFGFDLGVTSKSAQSFIVSSQGSFCTCSYDVGRLKEIKFLVACEDSTTAIVVSEVGWVCLIWFLGKLECMIRLCMIRL